MSDQINDLILESTGPAPEEKPKRGRKAGIAAKKSAAKSENAKVLPYRHDEKRTNNPEVGMVKPENDPDEGKTVYAYDPHLDPALNFDSQRAAIEQLIDDALASGDKDTMQLALEELKRLQTPYLNWAGKAEGSSVAIDNVSLHVHERIDPQRILESVKQRMKREKAGVKEAMPQYQHEMFAAPFETLPLREALDFYHHEKGWSNRLIAGDSLLVMNSLLQKESMAGRVQMIYIDPPYGIKYGSNFQPFVNKRDVKDRKDEDLTQEPEMIKAFRDTWELGIHSYLTYLRDRLLLAKELLNETGSVFVQISDENLHHVREVMEEVFGPENFCSLIIAQKTTGAGSPAIGTEILATVSDFVLWYAKDRSRVKYRPIFNFKELGKEGTTQYKFAQDARSSREWRLTEEDIDSYLTGGADFRVFAPDNLTSQTAGETTQFEFEHQGKRFYPGKGGWKTNAKGMDRICRADRIKVIGATAMYRRYLDDFAVSPINTIWRDVLITGFAEPKVYVVQTSQRIIERCQLMTTDPGDLVLDPTCGSGTTAYVAEKWGRRWITCDTSRVAVTLAKQRLMTASFDYYELRYPHEGLRGGFIYKTVPHVTLKSIANNPDIDVIYDRMHPAIESALAALNKAAEQKYQEWEVPFECPEDWDAAAKKALEAFHAARQAMQKAMDQSIADNADQEILYDQPAIAKDKLRIAGPFTVEAVPAPTVLALAEGVDQAQSAEAADITVARSGETNRQTTWRDELLRTGIRGKGGQKLEFADLETLPGTKYLHATGTLKDSGERVVVSFGPEHALLEQRQVSLALTEAEKLRPAPKFVIFCAFDFDPEAAKDIDEVMWPGVTLLKAKMNTDLLTEDLKKARSSNQSFWLMGQPDVSLRQQKDGLYVVEVNGFDYFDTKTGELKSGGKKNIAMWLLDTDYDERSLFPSQVFFPMAGDKDGWGKLKKTIRAELDESKLDQFRGTVSLPFEAGDNQKVAVKIVDDRGIESLKIMPLEPVL